MLFGTHVTLYMDQAPLQFIESSVLYDGSMCMTSLARYNFPLRHNTTFYPHGQINRQGDNTIRLKSKREPPFPSPQTEERDTSPCHTVGTAVETHGFDAEYRCEKRREKPLAQMTSINCKYTLLTVKLGRRKILDTLSLTEPPNATEHDMDIKMLIEHDSHTPQVNHTGGQVFFFRHYKQRSGRLFTKDQTMQLMREYEQNRYPDWQKRQLLAEEMSTTARTVQIWFQNRRQRDKI
ncbi:homeobox protein Hox-A7 [Planoprotostelium fungivorum]|uniref:Homeobox protein Hox-A7 n=1 Tax=Planoprotostelium fungivorum TaxID=1890364 RepID=A0A2P6N4F4_9EUKA|nr:homeobox protein Hox-A7 [Planoprotostelium fungivorum]